jgi:formylglycine-generating enzyme required for sulfatase activity
MNKMILVEGGTFLMGNTLGKSEGENNETPVHEVKLTYNYWIGKYPVTFKKYMKYCMESRILPPLDQGWGCGRRPVIDVSWWDAIAYCNWLSEKEGLPIAYDSNGNLLDGSENITETSEEVEGYRLPTEAEWEYAARGGQKATQDWKFSGSSNLEEVGWYCQNSRKKTHKVGKKKPNELGIFDMSGNVWEWCHDWYGRYSADGIQTNPTGGPDSGLSKVLRGGSWVGIMHYCRVAYRCYNAASRSDRYVGFRVVKTCSKKEQAC